FDMTFPFQVSVPLLNDLKIEAPQAVCVVVPLNATRDVVINRNAPPFNNPSLRQAVAFAIDHKAFTDILLEGRSSTGAGMMPPPEGVWGMPQEMLAGLPGYDPDVEKNRIEARKLMQSLSYGPENRLKIKLSTRNTSPDRDSAVILPDQLKEVYIDAEPGPIEIANWFPMVTRGAYKIGLNTTANAIDEPDQMFYENYACGSENNVTKYCNPELQKLFEEQSMQADQDRRKRLVWEIDKKLQEDQARPIIFHLRSGNCWDPHVKGVTIMIDSVFNGWRFEDVSLDR